jgi:ribosomal protein L37AE/L43A
MVRIDTSNLLQKRRYACPHQRQHRDWRVVDGLIECRSCGETYRELVDLKTGETIRRDDIDFVGPHADHQGQFGKPTVE